MDLSPLLADALVHTTFSGAGVLTPDDLRSKLAEASWGSPPLRQALASRPNVGDHVLNPVIEALRDRLTPHLDVTAERIGHSFRIAGSGRAATRGTPDRFVEFPSTSSLADVAAGLVRAAAVLGPVPAAALFDGWVRGEPLRFKVCLVLGGAYVSDHLELSAGLRLFPLPTSSDGLPLSMPDMDNNRVNTILGHPLLEIDVFTRPVFFPPLGDDDAFPALQSITALAPASVDVFMIALSLVCERHVGVAWAWSDFGPAGLFAAGSPTGLMGPGRVSTHLLGRGYSYSLTTNVTRVDGFDPPAPHLFANRLWRAWELLPYLQERHSEDPRFRIAVTRWYQSAFTSTAWVDRVVDLRIALESLYLDSDRGELGFRLATTAARYLGATLAERRAIRKTVSDFYDLASRVIHGTNVDLTHDRNADLIGGASKLCRDGILKILEQRHQPKWSDVLLA